MSCYHPLVGIPNGVDSRSGKMQYKILPYKENYFTDPYWQGKAVQIPCGQCIGCRLDYSRQWANRCMMELKYHDSAYFVTLTYNNEHVPTTWYYGEDGQAYQAYTLRKRDAQLWIKRLRKAFPNDHIRYFLAGEYGDKRLRPHYHAIVFGLHLDDIGPSEFVGKDFDYFSSRSLQKTWSVVQYRRGSKEAITPLTEAEKIGNVVIGDVSWDTCAYVARYILKKQKGANSEFYKKHNIEPPFVLMSRRPGIGRQYYDEHPDAYQYDYINLATKEGGLKFRPPRYFDKLHELAEPEETEAQKFIRRTMAEEAKKAKLAQSDLDYLSILQTAESVKQNQAKHLLRSVD